MGDALFRDIRYVGRTIRRSPGFAFVLISTFALAIGVNTAVFSLAESLIGQSLRVQEPEELASIAFQQKSGAPGHGFSYVDLQDIRKSTFRLFSGLAGIKLFQMDGLSVNGRNNPVWVNYVTGNFFTMLGITPASGRLIAPGEGTVPGADPVVVLSYDYWKARFGGDANIIGTKVRINGQPITVIGVTPQGFHGLMPLLDTQAYLPLAMAEITADAKRGFLTDPRDTSLTLIGRFRATNSRLEARSFLPVLGRRLAAQTPEIRHWTALSALPLSPLGPTADSNPLPVMAGTFLVLAAIVLFLGCVNVMNLLLVRATVREREMGIRAALGASKISLTGQLLTEGISFALLGSLIGIVFAFAATRALSSTIHFSTTLPIALRVNFDWRVFLYALATAALTGALVAVIPAGRVVRRNLRETVNASGRTSTGTSLPIRSALVCIQVAGALALSIVAGLFVRSLVNAQHIDLGFDPNHVINVTVDPHAAGYDEQRALLFLHSLLDRIRAMPGVQSASVASAVPLGYYSYSSDLNIQGYQRALQEHSPHAGYNSVSSAYFDTLRIPILRGRSISELDNKQAPYAAVVNEAMANRYWPGQNPVGRVFSRVDDANHLLHVVGVARNSRTADLYSAITPYFYTSLNQEYISPMTLQVRSIGSNEDDFLRRVVETIRSADPMMPVFDIQRMTQAIDTLNGLLLFRYGAGFAASLGALGLILALIGVYGVVSYSATQQTREIGIRRALGAQDLYILRLVCRRAFIISIIGIVIGIAAAAASARLVGSLFVGISPADPLTYIGASAIVCLLIVTATFVPAWRAIRLEPNKALRYE
jgi:macrolide transport system ATP-binding/permease protein